MSRLPGDPPPATFPEVDSLGQVNCRVQPVHFGAGSEVAPLEPWKARPERGHFALLGPWTESVRMPGHPRLERPNRSIGYLSWL